MSIKEKILEIDVFHGKSTYDIFCEWMEYHFYLLQQIVVSLCKASQTFYGLLISVRELSADKLQIFVVRIKPFKT